MPHRITRDEALARLEGEAPSECRLCDLIARPAVLARGEHACVVLSRYPVRWGHLLVIPRLHAERFTELPEPAWLEASALAHRAARALERALAPSRCYVASLGTSERGLPMTFPHVHLNVIPVDEPGARPRDVLTWQNGVMAGAPREWADLERALSLAW